MLLASSLPIEILQGWKRNSLEEIFNWVQVPAEVNADTRKQLEDMGFSTNRYTLPPPPLRVTRIITPHRFSCTLRFRCQSFVAISLRQCLTGYTIGVEGCCARTSPSMVVLALQIAHSCFVNVTARPIAVPWGKVPFELLFSQDSLLHCRSTTALHCIKSRRFKSTALNCRFVGIVLFFYKT